MEYRTGLAKCLLSLWHKTSLFVILRSISICLLSPFFLTRGGGLLLLGLQAEGHFCQGGTGFGAQLLSRFVLSKSR